MESDFENMNNEGKVVKEHKPERYAAIYARRSSTNQDNYSTETQIEEARKRCQKEGLLVYDVYEDRKSGRQVHYTERKSFMKLLQDLYLGMFKTIVIYKRDRLTRRTDDYLELKRIFEKHGIRVLYTQEPDQNMGDNYLARFTENMIFAISTFEPDKINKRAEEGRKAAREAGKYNSDKPAFGYTKKRDEASQDSSFLKYYEDPIYEFYPDELTWKLAKAIFGRYVELEQLGKPCKSIINIIKQEVNDKLNNIRAKYKNLEIELPSNFRKKDLEKTDIKYIIKNPRYAGIQTMSLDTSSESFFLFDESKATFIFDESLFKKCSNIPPLIPLDLWVAVNISVKQNEHQKSTKADSTTYFLKNKIRCEHCNTPVTQIDNIYSCKKRCSVITKYNLMKLVLEDITIKIDGITVKDLIDDKIKEINKTLGSLKAEFYQNEKSKKSLVEKYLVDKTSQDFADSLKLFKEKKDKIKDNILTHGMLLKKYKEMYNNVDKVKQKMAEEAVDLSTPAIEELMEKIIMKVVLSKSFNHEGSSISEIQFDI